MGQDEATLTQAARMADELLYGYKRYISKFPYADCRILLSTNNMLDTYFVPDLSYYWATLDGHCSWGRKALNWPDEKVKDVYTWCKQTFPDRFPAYLGIWQQIGPETVPYLYQRVVDHNIQLATLRSFLLAIADYRSIRLSR